MSQKKFSLVENKRTMHDGTLLYRIKAEKDFGFVQAGDIGGYVQGEHNLSQAGDCWIHDDAKVYGNAQVYGNASVHQNANIYDNAHIYGEAVVSGNAQVFGNAKVYNKAVVYDDSKISGTTEITGYTDISEHAEISGSAHISGNAQVSGNAKVSENAQISDNARLMGNAQVSGFANVHDNARLFGNAQASGNTNIFGFAYLQTATTEEEVYSDEMFADYLEHMNTFDLMNFYGNGFALVDFATDPIEGFQFAMQDMENAITLANALYGTDEETYADDSTDYGTDEGTYIDDSTDDYDSDSGEDDSGGFFGDLFDDFEL